MGGVVKNKNTCVCGTSLKNEDDCDISIIGARPRGTGVHFLWKCLRCGWLNIYFSRRRKKCFGLKKS
jgi:hypothetical protein